jgi:hypothetical protein
MGLLARLRVEDTASATARSSARVACFPEDGLTRDVLLAAVTADGPMPTPLRPDTAIRAVKVPAEDHVAGQARVAGRR